MTNKHLQGTVSELLASSYFVRKGWLVFTPIDGHGEYDLVVENNNGQLKKVQVKTIYWDSNKNRFLISCVTSHIRGNGRRVNKKYKEKCFDFLVGVERSTNAIYVIPFEKIFGRRSITVYPKGKTKTNGRYEDFEQYRME